MLGIVIVDYKGSNRTLKYISEELTKITTPHKTVVVINSCDDGAEQMFVDTLGAQVITADNPLPDPKQDLFVIPSNENLGFARGNNLGARFLIDNFHCNYLLFSNNDIILRDSDVVERMIERLTQLPNVGMIGPEVVGNDGKRQSPEPYISMADRHVWMYLLTPFISHARKAARFYLDYADKAQEGPHFRIMGSFFMMPTAAFTAIDMMDPNTFLYAEEMILSKRLEKAGYSVYFYPKVTVIHDHSATISKYIDRARKRKIQLASERYYYTTYCGVSPFRARSIIALSNLIYRAVNLLGH